MEENPYSAPESEIIEESNLEIGEIVLAKRSTRLIAAILDSFIMMLLLIPLSWAFSLINFQTGVSSLNDQIILALLGLFIYLIVNGKLLLSKGQTVGKKLLKIRVVNADTKTIPSAVDIIGKRYMILTIIGQFPLVQFVHLIDALLIFRTSKQCLHDSIANTIVIKA